MLNKFVSFIKENNLCTDFNKILFAISGGIDSVVMLDLFYRIGYQGIVAHCNFQLRDEESDHDEQFVRELSEKYEFPFYSKTFNTRDYAVNNGISIQMAARDLRYEWFEDIRFQTSCDLIAIAHNKNDANETFFINLSRGTGIRGLTGIREKSGNLIRPLLFAERDDIIKYADQNQLLWKEDSSNISLKYSRNKIRHKVIPAFQEINPRFNDVMMNNIKRLRAIEEIFLDHLEEKKQDLIIKDKNQLKIPIEKLLAIPSFSIWLYEILNEFDFSFSVVQDLIKSIEGIPGKIFFSSSHRLIKDRDYLILEAIKNESLKRYYIENPLDHVREPLYLDMEIEENTSDFKLSSDPDVAYLDLDKLEFPLIIRKWEKGDYFQPLGMDNMKKISDFFIDNKLSIAAKENTWLLCSGENITWVIGLRIDDRFKITYNTKRILKIMIND